MEKRVIGVGTKITVLLDGSLLHLTIGASNKGDLNLGIISCDTPLVKAVLGKNAGDVAVYTVAEQKHEVKIIEVI